MDSMWRREMRVEKCIIPVETRYSSRENHSCFLYGQPCTCNTSSLFECADIDDRYPATSLLYDAVKEFLSSCHRPTKKAI